MVETAQIKTALTEELSIILGVAINGHTKQVEELGLDYFGTMQVIAFLEDTYGIEIPDELLAVENFSTVDTMVQWTTGLLD